MHRREQAPGRDLFGSRRRNSGHRWNGGTGTPPRVTTSARAAPRRNRTTAALSRVTSAAPTSRGLAAQALRLFGRSPGLHKLKGRPAVLGINLLRLRLQPGVGVGVLLGGGAMPAWTAGGGKTVAQPWCPEVPTGAEGGAQGQRRKGEPRQPRTRLTTACQDPSSATDPRIRDVRPCQHPDFVACTGSLPIPSPGGNRR